LRTAHHRGKWFDGAIWCACARCRPPAHPGPLALRRGRPPRL